MPVLSSPRLWWLIGAVYGFLAVSLGAFGAHALKARLDSEMLSIYRTAVEYQFYHVPALLAVALLMVHRQQQALVVAGVCFAVGILVFSGSLYALSLSGIRVLGAITPIGGMLLLAGWLVLAYAGWRSLDG